MAHTHEHSCDHEHGEEHGHGHEHGHAHGPGHSHAPKDFNKAFAVGVGLNITLVVVQVVFGLLAGSLALVADAGHNFADVLGLLLAWWANKLGKSRPTKKHTYGFRGVSILAALANAVLLLVTMGAVGWEAITRLNHPEPVEGITVMWVAGLGIVINAASALLFYSGRKSDLNIRGAFLHLAADAGISLGVVIAGGLILWTHKSWIDPVVSLAIVAAILYSTWGLLKDSVNLALQAVPEGISRDAVKKYLEELPDVKEVHDLHIWAMSTSEVALTSHLVMARRGLKDSFLTEVAHELRERFGIGHATIQVENGDPKHPCQLAPDEHV
jgi:cobalt-zinc-cadmium efflux system protein